jgi:hypothetical protein
MKGKVEGVMRINDSYNPQVTPSPAKPVEPKPKPVENGGDTEVSKQDASELTGLTARVMQSLSEPNPIRLARVQQLKALYQAGAYEASSPAITRAMVDASLGQGLAK